MNQPLEHGKEDPGLASEEVPVNSHEVVRHSQMAVTLLTGGIDRPYMFGLVTELVSKGVQLDVIGSDNLEFEEFRDKKGLNFLNLQGSLRPDVSAFRKVLRLARYYARLIRYSATAKSKIFHILWNNKLEMFDRMFLMLYFRLLGKRIILTAHNVNKGKRDSRDTYLNRATLGFQYRLADHIFVHTENAKVELRQEFGLEEAKITVIPFGINNSVPTTSLSEMEAKDRLGIGRSKKAILFFGRITQYKGLDVLIKAFQKILTRRDDYVLLVAGRPENDCTEYWNAIREELKEDVEKGRALIRADHIPENETELYFKAADVLVLPYIRIYQSGVLLLGYSFGLPVLAADLDALREEIIEGRTGFVFRPGDPDDLVACIEKYFSGEIFANLPRRRREIKEFAARKHSWDTVGKMTASVYVRLNLPSSSSNHSQQPEANSIHNLKAPHEAAPADPN